MDVREKLEVIAHLGDHISYKEDIGIFYDSALAKVVEDAYMTLKNGVTVQNWISVKDREPEENTAVLTYRESGIEVEYRWYKGWDNDEFSACPVTHWMPLPEPPKGE